MIKVTKINSTKLFIDCSNQQSKELRNWFSAKAPNYRFHPKFKQGVWDGNLYWYDIKNNLLPIGLLHDFVKFCKKGNYEYTFENYCKEKISFEQFKNFLDTINLNPKFELREYQIQAAIDVINYKNINIHAVTSSGKTLILYFIARWFESKNKKCLFIFPNVSLIQQIYSDFEDYGWENVGEKCHQIFAGQRKIFNAPVILSSWQSLSNDKTLFKLFSIFDVLIIDEAHLASGKSINEISSYCISADYRIGCSGTYPEYHTADWFTIIGSLGPIKTYATYKFLQDNEYIVNLKIYVFQLNYEKKFRESVMLESNKNFALETDLINLNPNRNNFILKMIENIKGNTLILFTKKEKHGIPLYNLLKENSTKKIFYIDGSIDPKEREQIRKQIEFEENIIIQATYATFSTGISVKNIRNIIFASEYKSKVKVLQSIGRGLRKMEGKNLLTLYDLVDNLKIPNQFENYAMKHFKERIKIYQTENFKWKLVNFEIKN